MAIVNDLVSHKHRIVDYSKFNVNACSAIAVTYNTDLILYSTERYTEMDAQIKLPVTNDVLVLRTDFSDDAAWHHLCLEIETPDSEFGFIPYVEFLNDERFSKISIAQIFEAIPEEYTHTFIFVVDAQTMSMQEPAVLCVDLHDPAAVNFRVIPGAMWSVENNLSIANMDFEEFVANAQAGDGVFRGF